MQGPAASEREHPDGKRWTLLTSHGHVLFYLASEPDATVRQITEATGISERRVMTVLRDLEDAGMIDATRVGTRKHYEVNTGARFRHPTLQHVKLREVLGTLRVRSTRPDPIRWRG